MRRGGVCTQRSWNGSRTNLLVCGAHDYQKEVPLRLSCEKSAGQRCPRVLFGRHPAPARRALPESVGVKLAIAFASERIENEMKFEGHIRRQTEEVKNGLSCCYVHPRSFTARAPMRSLLGLRHTSEIFCRGLTRGLKLHLSTATQANSPSIFGMEKLESMSRCGRSSQSKDDNLKLVSALELWEY